MFGNKLKTLLIVFLFLPFFVYADTQSELDHEIRLLEKSMVHSESKNVNKRKTMSKSRVIKKINKSAIKKSKKLPNKKPIIQSTNKITQTHTVAQAVEVVPPPGLTNYNFQEEYKEPTAIKKKKRTPWGLNVYALYSFSDSITSSNNSRAALGSSEKTFISDYTSEFHSANGYGFGLEYSKKSIFKVASAGIGIGIGATYELGRKIDRGYIGYNATNYNYYNNNNSYLNNYNNYNIEDPELSLILPYANVNININDTYVFTGINYSIPDMSSANDENYSGQLGYQLGLGTQLTSYLAIEIVHRWVNFEASPIFYNSSYQSINSYDIRYYRDERSGLGILDDEELELKGFNINIVATF
ncbi:MAG: hypothetical protein KDD58_15170 [Bdellovibrionales bacterium]|nr:hypothetical protein [Bdellovibrionales bacterium]